MKPNFSEIEYNNSKPTDKLSCICYNCNKTFFIFKKNITQELTQNRGRIKFCSIKCHNEFRTKKQIIKCSNCGKAIEVLPFEIKNFKNHFCSSSCAATYNNKHKTTGTRRSKLEQYLEQELTKLHPDLEFHFNRKDTINSELDIYIPSLKLAFELNGIFHYEPIYGNEKLDQIQNNDNRKFQACLEQGIELCIIDSSKVKYFKRSIYDKFVDIVNTIITNKSKNLLNF